MSREVRAVIDRLLVEHPLVGPAYLIEVPYHTGQPISKEVACSWLIKTEQLAGRASGAELPAILRPSSREV